MTTTGVPTFTVKVDKDPRDPNADVPHEKRVGNCLELSAEYLMENDGLLIHGSIYHPVHSEQRIGHAWVVTTDEGVFEPTLGLWFPRWEYYFSWAQVRVDAMYDPEQARVQMLRHGHYGTWDESIEWSGVWGEGVRAIMPDPSTLTFQGRNPAKK